MDERLEKAQARKWFERARRFWVHQPAPDHPLSEREREPRSETTADEAARSWAGIFGDTLGSTHKEG